jgi:hypothetical protein
MIRGIGAGKASTHYQTLNETECCFLGCLKKKKGTPAKDKKNFLVGRVLVSRTDDADSSASRLKGPKYAFNKIPKGYPCIVIVGLWSWRSTAVKKCVATYLPNVRGPKMDDAKMRTR